MGCPFISRAKPASQVPAAAASSPLTRSLFAFIGNSPLAEPPATAPAGGLLGWRDERLSLFDDVGRELRRAVRRKARGAHHTKAHHGRAQEPAAILVDDF